MPVGACFRHAFNVCSSMAATTSAVWVNAAVLQSPVANGGAVTTKQGEDDVTMGGLSQSSSQAGVFRTCGLRCARRLWLKRWWRRLHWHCCCCAHHRHGSCGGCGGCGLLVRRRCGHRRGHRRGGHCLVLDRVLGDRRNDMDRRNQCRNSSRHCLQTVDATGAQSFVALRMPFWMCSAATSSAPLR